MIKNILLAAVCTLAATAVQAQETLYLVKDNKVIAKYPVSEVDYATFKLPEGVTDIDTPDDPNVENITFLGGTGTYFGTTDNVANFQIELSTGMVGDESFPRSFLYLQFMGNAADYKDLKFEEGTYTIGDGETLEPFKFHPGVMEVVNGEMGVGGSFLVDMESGEDVNIRLVKGGSFTITPVSFGYTVKGNLTLDDDTQLDFAYEGFIIISNNSDEKDPADEVPNPESTMTGDITIGKIAEAYAVNWSGFFADEPRFDYIYMLLYTNSNYDEFVQLGLIVDTEKSDGVLLPKGTYPIIKRTPSEFESHDLAAIPAFCVSSETMARVEYGCWYVNNYSDYSPLMTGEVEVLEDCTDLKKVNIRINLKDPEGHALNCDYNGKLLSL